MRQASFLALVLLCACTRPGVGEDGGAPAPSPRGGVKVPLPEGWSAQIAADQSFQAGPRGRPVLRIDLRPGAGALLPTAAQLQAGLDGELDGLQRVESHNAPGATVLRYRWGPDGGEGGAALLGAKRVGEDLFLCASVPGATEAELSLASTACLGLTVGTAPRR